MSDGLPWPKVSIVTPSYNQGQFIEETIRSVLLQGYPNLEYIIIDGGSSDNTPEIIREYEPWLTYWVSEPDRGQSHAINKGLRQSTGEIVAYLNSDDIYLPGTFRAVCAYFHKQSVVDVAYGDCRIINEDSQKLSLWRSLPFNLFREVCQNFIYQPTLFMRRRVVQKIGYFDESLRYTMDIDYWYRAGHDFNFAYLPIELACFRISSHSKTGTGRTPFVKERKKVVEKFLADCEDMYIKKQHKHILAWHHYTAGNELYSRNEFHAAVKEFLNAIRLDPFLIRALFCLCATFGSHVRTKIFPKIKSIYHLSPKP